MTLHYKTYGSGAPIIILHGLFGMLDNWKSIARKLAENYSVYTVDLRNHGKSFHSDEFNYKVLAEDLAQFAESQWLYQVNVVGHSLGGKAAMQFALDFPDIVERLVVIDIAPKIYPPRHTDVIDALLSIHITEITQRKEVENQLMTGLNNLGVVQFLMKNLARKKEGGFRWKMHLRSLVDNYENISRAIISDDTFDGPVLFVRGGKSNYIEDGDIGEIRELFPTAELETVEDAGHWVHADQPEQLLSVLREWLE